MTVDSRSTTPGPNFSPNRSNVSSPAQNPQTPATGAHHRQQSGWMQTWPEGGVTVESSVSPANYGPGGSSIDAIAQTAMEACVAAGLPPAVESSTTNLSYMLFGNGPDRELSQPPSTFRNMMQTVQNGPSSMPQQQLSQQQVSQQQLSQQQLQQQQPQQEAALSRQQQERNSRRGLGGAAASQRLDSQRRINLKEDPDAEIELELSATQAFAETTISNLAAENSDKLSSEASGEMMLERMSCIGLVASICMADLVRQVGDSFIVSEGICAFLDFLPPACSNPEGF